MKTKNKMLVFVLIAALFVIAACSGADNDNQTSDNEEENADPDPSEQNVEGEEELLSVKAEYSFCYDTGAYDPTLRSKCEDQITYKECKEWQGKEQGTSNTFFYATALGGEPTIPGRTANYYYIKVKYGDNKEITTDERAIFKEIEGDFMAYDDTGCYPNATIEMYNVDDELMDKMSFDYTEK